MTEPLADLHSATGYANVRNDPTIVALADKYKVSSSQIIMAWHVKRGTVAVPKSADAQRQKENITVSCRLLLCLRIFLNSHF